MIWTFLALLSLIALGGFISYYGDLQGRRWGKKRVSWFGLRPKHTAILITSLTGAFISLMSILTLLGISPVMRDVILRGEKAIRANKELSEQAGHYKYQIQIYGDEVLNAQREKEQKQTELAELQKIQVQRQQIVQQLQQKYTKLLTSLAQT